MKRDGELRNQHLPDQESGGLDRFVWSELMVGGTAGALTASSLSVVRHPALILPASDTSASGLG